MSREVTAKEASPPTRSSRRSSAAPSEPTRQYEVVLPQVQALAGGESSRPESGARVADVVGLAGLEPAGPPAGEPIAAGERVTFDLRDRAIVEARFGVELRVEPALEESCRQLLLRRETQRDAARGIVAAIAVAVIVEAEIGRVGDRVEAGALPVPDVERVSPGAGGAGDVRPMRCWCDKSRNRRWRARQRRRRRCA